MDTALTDLVLVLTNINNLVARYPRRNKQKGRNIDYQKIIQTSSGIC